jgi:hypothetical protein
MITDERMTPVVTYQPSVIYVYSKMVRRKIADSTDQEKIRCAAIFVRIELFKIYCM